MLRIPDHLQPPLQGPGGPLLGGPASVLRATLGQSCHRSWPILPLVGALLLSARAFPGEEAANIRFLAITNFSSFVAELNADGEPRLLSPWMSAPKSWRPSRTSNRSVEELWEQEVGTPGPGRAQADALTACDQTGPHGCASPPTADGSFRELIVSWNVELPPGAFLETEARVRIENRATRFYSFGRWSAEASSPNRHSVRDQADADGDVRTDVLVLRQPARWVQLRLSFGGMPPDTGARVKFVGLCLTEPDGSATGAEPAAAARGRVLEVPTRTQLAYPGGSGWCSPTSLSMLLAHWAVQLQQPTWDWDVPRLAASVYDPQWPGTGNWAFNVALAGSFPGMRAYVSRFASVEELEHWIAAGVPVAASVSYAILQGRAREPEDGHLVVCVGFEENGDVVLNDPGTTKRMRRSFPRADFAAAWRCSGSTVYLIHPEAWPLPENRWGHW